MKRFMLALSLGLLSCATVQEVAVVGASERSSVDTEPQVIDVPRCDYPWRTVRFGVQGDVRLLVTVDSRGMVTTAEVVDGPGYGLEPAAQKALLRSRFTPAMKNGQPVEYTLVYRFVFELD